jgi:hypothetical protein
LEAWAKKKNLLPYQGVAIINMYDSKTECRTIDASKGAVYRAVEYKNGRTISSEYLLYHDATEGTAHFNLSKE